MESQTGLAGVRVSPDRAGPRVSVGSKESATKVSAHNFTSQRLSLNFRLISVAFSAVITIRNIPRTGLPYFQGHISTRGYSSDGNGKRLYTLKVRHLLTSYPAHSES